MERRVLLNRRKNDAAFLEIANILGGCEEPANIDLLRLASRQQRFFGPFADAADYTDAETTQRLTTLKTRPLTVRAQVSLLQHEASNAARCSYSGRSGRACRAAGGQ